jgi:hypothetical protein
VNVGPKLAAYGLLLAAVLAGGAAIGAAAGPIDVGGGEHDADEHGTEPEVDTPALPAGGLLVSQDGYTLDVPDRTLEAGTVERLTFTIDGPDGAPLTAYEVAHERELHFIVVSSDLVQFAHLHPERDSDGTWSVDVPALPAGGYRAYADFKVAGGAALTLGTDLTVPGATATPVPLVERRTTTVDGYDVELTGDAMPGSSSQLTVTVRRDGEVITTEPYLGAGGHLVAIRDGDLAYLHVHPIDEEPTGPVAFAVEVPSPGVYGLYFDFAHDGKVRTASFVLQMGTGSAHDADGAAPATGHGDTHG